MRTVPISAFPAPVGDSWSAETSQGVIPLPFPLPGSGSWAPEFLRTLTAVLDELQEGYAPRRMVKLGHPDRAEGLIIASARTIRLPEGLYAPGGHVVPLLAVRAVTTTTEGTYLPRLPVWYPARLVLPGSTGIDALSLEVYSDRMVLTPTGDAVEVRGAVWFPRHTRNGLSVS